MASVEIKPPPSEQDEVVITLTRAQAERLAGLLGDHEDLPYHVTSLRSLLALQGVASCPSIVAYASSGQALYRVLR